MVQRDSSLLIALFVAACGSNSDRGPDATPPPDAGEAPRWRFETPTIGLAPAEERYVCSYHQIPGDLGPIGRVAFYGTAGVHSVSLEVVAGPVVDGAVDQICARPPRAATLVSLDRQLGELVLPGDAPLLLGDGLALVVRVHYLNPDDVSASGYGIVSWYGGTTVASQTSGLLSAIRTDFSVPPGTSTIETSCRPPGGVRLIAAYPVSHSHADRLSVSDDRGLLVSTFDWAHPVPATWMAPYYQPAGALRARCDYLNDTGQIVLGGDRLFADERCGVAALIVPASGLQSCP